MIRDTTPVENYAKQHGLLVKREDLACLPPGPPFSKTRGVYSHVAAREEEIIGVLDTRHSQGGHAVAFACKLLGKRCIVFYPGFKADNLEPKESQLRAEALGADLGMLPAGRSAVLFHGAKKHLARIAGEEGKTAYMMPNALKLPESVLETAAEVHRTPSIGDVGTVLVPASSATLAAGVLRGLTEKGWRGTLVVHLGYSRTPRMVLGYMEKYLTDLECASAIKIEIVDEGYEYANTAREGALAEWPCNEYYDLKTFRWWLKEGRAQYKEAMLWNIG